MANLFDRFRNAGAALLDGVAQLAASFQARHERHITRAREQFPQHAPRRRRPEQHHAGERAFSTMMRASGGIGWPASWTQDRSVQIQTFHRWVYVAVDSIASRIAAMPPQVALVRPAANPPPLHGPVHKALEARYKKSLHAVKPHEDILPVGPDHPLVRLLARPNAWIKSPGRLWYQLVMYLCLTGNAYLWVVPDQAFGKPLEIWIIPSHWCFGPKIGPAGFQFYQIMPFVGGVGGFTLPAEEVVHFAFDNPFNPVDGWAPTQAASEWIDVSQAQDQSRYFAFQNGSQANGALELGPTYDPDEKDIDAIGQKFLARYQGVRNAGVPVILPPDVKFVPLTIAPKEMAWIEGFDQMRDAILACFRVPHEIAGITDAGSHTAYYGPMVQFDENAIFPKVRLIGDTFTACVCRRWDDNLRLFWEDHSPPDPAEVNAKLQLDLEQGVRSINEARAERGLQPRPEPIADELLLDPNKIPASMFMDKLKQDQEQQKMMAEAKANPPGAPGGGAPGAKEKPEETSEKEKPNESKPGEPDRDEAEDAALEANDASWDSPSRARRKAHEYNRQAEAMGGALRVVWDEVRQVWCVVKAWDESQHPREPSGSPHGGEFTSGGGGRYGQSSRAGTPNARPAGGQWSHEATVRPVEHTEPPKKKPARKPKTPVPDDPEAIRIAEELYQRHKERAATMTDPLDVSDSYWQYEQELADAGIVPTETGFGWKKPKKPTVQVSPTESEDGGFLDALLSMPSGPTVKESLHAEAKEKYEDATRKVEELEAELRDWQSRKYKPNRSRVSAEAGNEHAGETTIGAANERRRQRAIDNLWRQIDEAKEEQRRAAFVMDKLAPELEKSWHGGNGFFSGVPGGGTPDKQEIVTAPVSTQTKAAVDLLHDAPDIRQPNRYFCGAAAAMTAGMLFGVGPDRIEDWAKALGTTVERSTHPYAIRDYLRQLGLQVIDRHNMTLEDLVFYTSMGHPVIVCVQDYGQEVPSEAEFQYGHYLTVLDLLPGVVICQDSSLENLESEPGGDVSGGESSGNISMPGRILVDAETWLKAWHDEDAEGNKFTRFGIAVGPPAGFTGVKRKYVQPPVEKTWDESKHPRGGDPENRGRFSEASGSSDQLTNRELPPKPPSDSATNREGPQHSQQPSTAEHHFRPSPSDERSPKHQAMATSPMKRGDRLGVEGVNQSYLLTLEDGNKGVFKPAAEEHRGSRVGIPDNTQYQREVAASRVADVLGMNDLVPATTFRDQTGHGIGSIQAFVEGSKHSFESEEPFDGDEDAKRAAAFDYLVGHLDRHKSNWGLKDGKLVLWDNGLSFPERYAEDDFFNLQFWQNAYEKRLALPDVAGWDGKWPDVEKQLKESGLSETAIGLTRERFEALTSGKYKRISELPSLLDKEKNLGDLVFTFSYDGRFGRLQRVQTPFEWENKSWEDQPRVPAGKPEGGEWTVGAVGGSSPSPIKQPRQQRKRTVQEPMSETEQSLANIPKGERVSVGGRDVDHTDRGYTVWLPSQYGGSGKTSLEFPNSQTTAQFLEGKILGLEFSAPKVTNKQIPISHDAQGYRGQDETWTERPTGEEVLTKPLLGWHYGGNIKEFLAKETAFYRQPNKPFIAGHAYMVVIPAGTRVTYYDDEVRVDLEPGMQIFKVKSGWSPYTPRLAGQGSDFVGHVKARLNEEAMQSLISSLPAAES